LTKECYYDTFAKSLPSYRTMSISAKGEYAARAMLHLALTYPHGIPARTLDIARQQKIPKKYLEQIMLLFKKEGLVQSKPGLNGGYTLSRRPREITMAEIVRAVDGPLAPMRCVSKTAYSRCTCTSEDTCGLRTVWQQARDAVADVLEQITLEDVAARSRELASKHTSGYSI
jgi:Rrf2 family protein